MNIYIYKYIYVYIYMYVYIYICIYMYIYIYTHTHTHTRTPLYPNVYIYIYIYIKKNIYTHTHTHTHTHTPLYPSAVHKYSYTLYKYRRVHPSVYVEVCVCVRVRYAYAPMCIGAWREIHVVTHIQILATYNIHKGTSAAYAPARLFVGSRNGVGSRLYCKMRECKCVGCVEYTQRYRRSLAMERRVLRGQRRHTLL